ncbi:hypothetical protein TWF696_001719 [Orbilia brochopaga]|uniref:Azaphilone pigments biosynthesis cluster protein L N-terminal domain-containing protein n=1 Tax=Orbilia brochopaga TaxID=3140254 RepID=A0AAV9U8B7_9PEZI
MDPLSITASVIGILASFASVSLKLHELQETFAEAKSEAERIKTSLAEFALILKQIEDVSTRGVIAPSLRDDLYCVLGRLEATVVQMEAYLKSAMKKRWLRGVYWAFVGKRQCLELQQRLDSYKSTLTITLTIVNIICGYQVQDTADQILGAIHSTRQQIVIANYYDNFILERYLTELESVYEVSTGLRTIKSDIVPDTYNQSYPKSQPGSVYNYKPLVASIPESEMESMEPSAMEILSLNVPSPPPRSRFLTTGGGEHPQSHDAGTKLSVLKTV